MRGCMKTLEDDSDEKKDNRVKIIERYITNGKK